MPKRSNGEGSAGWIEKNGKKYWRISITLGFDPVTGRQKRKDFYGKTQREAKEKLKEFQGKYTNDSDTSTLGNFMYNWLWNVKRPALKPSTFERWEGIYRLYIKPNKGLNNKKIADLDTMFLQKVTNQLLETHTLNQVKNMNKCISMCLEYAITINKINSNPTKGVVYPKDNTVNEDKDNYITETEQKTLITALKGDEMEGIILLGLMCGLRLGEAMALQTKDINFKTNTITINKSVKYIWTGEYTKEGKKVYENRLTIPKTKSSIREVPLPALLVPIIKAEIKKNKENKLKYGELYFDNNLIFCRESGDYIDNKKPNRHLKLILKKANIETDIHYHSLRHIFITNCLSKDINPKVIMDWVGHKDIKMTMLVYAEINKDKNKKEYEKINNMFD